MRVAAVERPAPRVIGLALERLDGAPTPFRPGQWVSVAVPVGSSELWRAYSIASPESPATRIEILVSRIPIGLVSEALHGLSAGARLRMSDPGGTFRLADDHGAPRPPGRSAPGAAFPPAAVFAATGTGIAPYRSMIRAALALPGGPVTLVHGVRAEEDLLFRGEWEALERREPRFRYRPTLSRGGADWAGRTGYVGPYVLEALAEHDADGRTADIYLCGLRRMTDTLAHRLRELGRPRERIHVERFD